MSVQSLIFVILLLFSISFTATAEVYRWVDENGKVHFSDRKPSGQTKGKSKQTQVTDITKEIDKTNIDSSHQDRQHLERIFAKESPAEQRYNQQQNNDDKRVKQQQTCNQARHYLSKIQGPVYFKRKDGSSFDISEKERQNLEQRVKQYISKNCHS